jgi:hypothetical protein
MAKGRRVTRRGEFGKGRAEFVAAYGLRLHLGKFKVGFRFFSPKNAVVLNEKGRFLRFEIRWNHGQTAPASEATPDRHFLERVCSS